VGAFFEPRSVAVVGASPDPARGGHRIVRNLLEHFDGSVHAVNPHAAEVLGLPCHARVSDIPGDVDLAVVFIPAPAVPGVVADCIAKGVKAVCIESGGFADAGPDGERLQAELEALTRSSDTRVWGPNCAGYVSTRPALSTSFVVTPGIKPGNVALVAQSGMMAAALLVQLISQDTLAVSKACSIGNKVDVGESDLLEYLADDPDTEVVACYLESIVDGARFAAAVDRAVCRAPLVTLMGGRTESGARAALSHTGSVAGQAAMVAGLLRQRGVLQAADFMELVDLAGTLATLPVRAAGDRVAVLTFSGAAGVVATDLFAGSGLRLADLAPQTRARLAGIYPPWLEPTNPVDIWSTVELRGLEPTLDVALPALLEDPGVDSVLLVSLAFEFFAGADLAGVTAAAATAGKPVVAWVFGEDEHLATWRRELASSGIPACRDLRLAVRTLEAVALRQRALDRLAVLDATPPPAPPEPPPAWPAAEAVLAEDDAKRMLAAWGLPVVPERRVRTPDEAVGAAAELGYPAVVKLVAPGLAHKTEVGGVAVGLRDAGAVREAAADMLARAAADGTGTGNDPVGVPFGAGLLVQPMRSGVEVLLGARRHPSFGPVVVLGVGGVDVEARAEVSVRPLPLTAGDARAMVDEVPALATALAGGRGRPPADVDALVESVLALARFIATAPTDVVDAEINPLIVGAAGQGASAVDALVVRHEPDVCGPLRRWSPTSSTAGR
jgi:acetyltransferase